MISLDVMAGRGRGKSSGLTFDVGQLGFGRGEHLPKAELQPPPLYPQMEHRPTPLSSTEVDEYLLALSQEFRGSIRDSPFYLKPKTAKRDIERYTDRYKQNQKGEDKSEWTPDWRFFPSELKPFDNKRKSLRTVKVSAKALAAKRPKTEDNVVKKLESIENETLNSQEEISSNAKKEVDGDEEVEEEFEEDDDEDDNDYNFDYYDDGGDTYGGDEDGEEGPVY